ncbi:hypothetical protein [Novosphingobium sp. SG720]|uniref:hypothetical protein n=1 Tax=Novosphingobium sp. SG720 TaxID=2586998 RepID=UPI0014476A23|nr:hypothetical protein [Novosphingobium sp. SG720]
MSFGATLVAIVAILAWASLRHRRHSTGQAAFPASDPAENVALAREVAALRNRVEVLERILTDQRGSIDLAREIESLRER